MFDPQRPSGGGFGAVSTAPANPFGQQQPATNPFANVSTNTSAQNPFANVAAPVAPTATNPFSTQTKPANPFGQNGSSVTSSQSTSTPFSVPAKPSPFGSVPTQPSTNGTAARPFVQAAWPDVKQTTGKRKGDISDQAQSKFSRNSPDPQVASNRHTAATRGGRGNKAHNGVSRPQQPRAPTRPASTKDSDLSIRVHQALARDNLKPPTWPTNPGSAGQRKAAENFREAYNAYREKARACLIRANLIDDPDQRRALSDALEFKGICEDMCPDWERITRIVQHDVKREEREDVNGESQANIELMVTRHARSSAGQDAPLPMDVRSPGALKRTLNYMIDELIPEDHLLPARHNFLWDRTRAIRKDFIYQEYAMGHDEMKDYIYCLETIARFHVTALHLLTQSDFASKDFSAQQENEQLEKTLISLMQAYDDCAKQSIECKNEADFRSYYIIVMADNPAWMDVVQSFAAKFWNDSDSIRTASILVESLKNVWDMQGPLMPPGTSEMALPMISTFFDIVASPSISYTMACFAEIHFPKVRRLQLKILREAYWRPKAGPTDLTPAVIQRQLRLDTEEEAVDFAKSQGFEFGIYNGQTYAINNSRQPLSEGKPPRIFSRSIVEKKRGDHSLAEVIYKTFYEEPSKPTPTPAEPESLFVDGAQDMPSQQSSSQPKATSTQSSSPSPFGFSTSSAIGTAPNPPTAPPTQASTFTKPAQAAAPAGSNPVASAFSAPSQTSSSTPTSSLFPASSPAVSSIVFQPTAAAPTVTTDTSNSKRSVTFEPDKLAATLEPPKASPFSFPTGQKPLGGPSTLFTSTTAETPQSNSPPPQSIVPPTAPAITSGFIFPGSASNAALSAQPASTSLFDKPNTPPAAPKPNAFKFGSGEPANPITKPQEKSVPAQPPANLPAAAPTSSCPAQPVKPVETAPAVQRDPFDLLTRWYICADRGLMEEHLEQWVVETLLMETWDKFEEGERERIRKEEDEKSWAEARQFREYSLKVTYFYRWLDNFRKRRVIKRIQLEKEKARQWNTPEERAKRAAAKAKALTEQRMLMVEKTQQRVAEQQKLRDSQTPPVAGSLRRPRRDSLEEALLPPSNQRGSFTSDHAPAETTTEAANNEDHQVLPGEKALLRFENQRRKKRGLQPLRKYPEAKAFKEGSKSAMLKALSSGAGRDTMSMSTTSLRNSTFSSSYRSSLGYNSSRVSKATLAKPTSRVSDPYWRLKANGLVQMPNGEYLHESLAIPMLEEGRRFPGLGDFGISQSPGTSANANALNHSPARSIDIPQFSPPPPPVHEENGLYRPRRSLSRSRISRSPSMVSASGRIGVGGMGASLGSGYQPRRSFSQQVPPSGRKRVFEDLGEEHDHFVSATARSGTPDFITRGSGMGIGREGSVGGVASLHKRAKSSVRGAGDDVHSVSSDSDFLASIDRLLKDVQDVGRSIS